MARLAGTPGAAWLEHAWALKNACYAAWSSAPDQVAQHAQALSEWAGQAAAQTDLPAAVHEELQALADWTGAIAHITRGRMQDAIDGLDRAAQALRQLGQAAPAAQTQVPKIMALSMLGQFDGAARCAEAAQRELVALGDSRTAAKVGLNLGALHERRGDYAQAAQHSRTAAVLFARAGDTEHSVMADINLANALTSLGDVDEALRIHARAHMRAGAHGLPVLQALVDEAVALIQLSRGQYRQALAGFETARRSYERLGMAQHLAIAEKQLADAYLELRLLPEALALFDQSLERLRQLDVPDEQAWTLAQRGRTLALGGDWAAAGAALAQADGLFAAQEIGVGEAAVALARAELALAAGQPDEARHLARRAAAAFDAAALPDGRVRADLVQAWACLRAGRLDEARVLFEATRDAAGRLQLLAVDVRCRVGQGVLARLSGDLPAAKWAFEAAIAQFEEQRRALPGDDLRSAFLADHLQPYQELLQLALAAYERQPDEARAAAVLVQLERVRGRGLLDGLHGPQQTAAQDARQAAEDAETESLRNRLHWLHRRIQRLQDEGDSAHVLVDERGRAERELLERARRERLSCAADQPGDGSPRLAQAFEPARLQAALAPGDALLEYGVAEGELFACVVTREGITLHRHLARWDAVLESLRAARFQIETLRHGSGTLQAHLPALSARAQRRLQQLHALVMAPLAARLAPCRRLLIVPCGPLGVLPFAALHDGQRSLGEHIDLALAPSARLALHGLARRAAPAQRALVLGESSRLPHAAREAQTVAALFADGQAFVGAQAQLAVLEREAAQADVIHLACHAQFRTDNPMFSALDLHDGALSVERIAGLRLRPGTVVLSACETGLSAVAGDDEQVGLVRAFLGAGAARVVASLWPVDDGITSDFMSRFYGELRAGQSPAHALRTAQAAIRQRHPHPFHWAAFVLHGGW